jgi:peptide/nickel transport system permease protein
MAYWTHGLAMNRSKKGNYTYAATLENRAKVAGFSWLTNFVIRLWKEKPLGLVGGIITLLLLGVGIFADFLAPYGVNEQHLEYALSPPSAMFWLGTDNLGRDLLSRVIFGARISMIVGLGATTLATILSMIIGLVSGYVGGKFDLLVQRVVDAWLCFPTLVILMVLITIVGTGIVQIILVIGISWGIRGSRIIRSATIGVKDNTYVESSLAIGCSPSRVLIQHILPNIMAPAIILFTTRVPAIILIEASLSFLGYGVPPPSASWGGMLSGSGRSYMFQAPWIVIWPGLALAIVVYGINIFGDAVRDLLDPRLRDSERR